MKKKRPEKRAGIGIPHMPFDDALRKILKAPPQHQVKKKQREKK